MTSESFETADKIRLADAINALSRAPREVLDLLCRTGKSNKEMAEELNKSVKTIENHMAHALLATGFNSRLKLVIAIHGLPPGALRDPGVPAGAGEGAST